ncbi:MAG: hydantoinase/oxoprolinase family protein [Blastocatellia bacterium]
MKVRIGIDVGGTFTDVVVIDQQTRRLIGQLKLPTTHSAGEGVALGIVSALRRAMSDFSLDPEDVTFIAHSTTQATNALLEGDVARVGVIGVGTGIEGWLAKRATRVPPIALTARKSLTVNHRYLECGGRGERGERGEAGEFTVRARGVIAELAAEGVEVVVISEAFGVDQTEGEIGLAAEARGAGLLATSGHEVSSLYGLRVRTRTAVINAAILPKMIETAELTERCVSETGIEAPLMIMRSDGGVMSVGEVHRRPILTMLSGPAAGIAGALMHERVSDGIFIEVGGTSADISVIRDGSPTTRPARLNGHRMYLNTLDVRTLGVGGGSLIRVRSEAERAITDVGPRSAHIAGLGYACYTEPAQLAGATIEIVQPTPRDEQDHVVIRTLAGERIAITTTCAANCLGLVSADQFAYGNRESAVAAFQLLADWLGGNRSALEVARDVLKVAGLKVAATIEELMAEYQLAREQVILIGGGGGAASLVPFTGDLMGLEHRIARNAEVISPIGVAMAMVRDTVERNIVDPTPEDILSVRREATEAAVSAGAMPESIEVQVEVDRRRNLVRAVAMGTTELRRAESQDRPADRQDGTSDPCLAAARSMRLPAEELVLAAETENYLVFTGTHRSKSFLGRWGSWMAPRRQLRVVDRSGVVRLQRGAARVTLTRFSDVEAELGRAAEELTDFGDAGRTIPDIFIIYGGRIANFSGLATLEQVIALAGVELRSIDPETRLVVIACPRNG